MVTWFLSCLTPIGPAPKVRAVFERFLPFVRLNGAETAIRMSDNDPDARRLADLEGRLRKARGNREVHPEDSSPSKLGLAFRLVTELLAGVIVGGGIGWALDRVFGTS